MSSFSYAVHDLSMTLSQEEEFVEKECQGRDEGVVRSHETGPETSGESDIYSQLEQKERDLLLAAELGKALLERNEELQRKADLAQEDFNQRVEVLEQEKHELKLKFERLQGTSDARVHELQADIKTLNEELHNERFLALSDQEIKRTTLDQLMQQNESLRMELQWTKDRLEATQEELAEIKRQLFKRRTLSEENRYNVHQLAVEELEEKVYYLEEDKAHMESTIKDIVQEREGLHAEVEKLCKDVERLEKDLIDSKTKLSLCEEELNDTKDYNHALQQQFDEIKIQTSHENANNGSLYNELSLELSMTESDGPSSPSLGRAVLQHITNHFRPLASSSSPSQSPSKPQRVSESSLFSEDDTDSEMDINSPVRKNINVMKNVGLYAQLEEEEKENTVLRRTILDARNELQALYHSMKCSRSNTVTPTLTVTDTELREFDASCLNPAIENLKEVAQEFFPRSGNTSRRGSPTPEVNLLLNQIEDLETDLASAKEQLKRLQEDFTNCSSDLELKTKYMNELEAKVASLEKDVEELKEEKETLSIICAEVTNDNYDRVLQDRKEAQERESELRKELEKANDDISKLDCQLMEAIQQKIELSEQLEDWQVDIAALIEEQVQKQMRSTAKEHKQNDNNKKRRSTFGTITAGWSSWSNNITKANKAPVLNV